MGKSFNTSFFNLLKMKGEIICFTLLTKDSSSSNRFDILSNLGNSNILNIASNHHEKLNGKGYPRLLSDLSLCEKIVCVADIFAALTQKRNYKNGFTKEKTINILTNLAKHGEIDSEVVNKIVNKYDYFIYENSNLYKNYNNKLDDLKNQFNLLISSL